MTLSTNIIIATVVILIIYDIIIGYLRGAPGTLSVAAYEAAKKYPAVPLWAGILCGHLFMSQNQYIFKIAQAWPSIPFAFGYLCAWFFVADNKIFRLGQRFPVFPFGVGMIMGHCFASLVF